MPLWSLQEIVGDRCESNITSRCIGATCDKCCGGREEGDIKAKHRGICWQAGILERLSVDGVRSVRSGGVV